MKSLSRLVLATVFLWGCFLSNGRAESQESCQSAYSACSDNGGEWIWQDCESSGEGDYLCGYECDYGGVSEMSNCTYSG
jgi:hypothetical protein